MKKLWVIIVSYNSESYISQCLQSVLLSSVPCRVVVVDNASTDKTVAVIEEQFPEVDLIRSKTNMGFGRANNLAIQKALDSDASYIYLLNQDAWVETETFRQLINVCDRNPEAGIVSPVHFKEDWHTQEPLFSDYVKNGRNHNDPSLLDVDFVNAAGWMLPVRTVDKVGGFDPIFFMYGEDSDYINRLRFFGLKVLVHTDSRMVHARINSSAAGSAPDKMKLIEKRIRKFGIQIICRCKDISADPEQSIRTAKKEYFRRIVSSLTRLKVRSALLFYSEYKAFIRKIPIVRAHHNACRAEGRTFLNDSDVSAPV